MNIKKSMKSSTGMNVNVKTRSEYHRIADVAATKHRKAAVALATWREETPLQLPLFNRRVLGTAEAVELQRQNCEGHSYIHK